MKKDMEIVLLMFMWKAEMEKKNVLASMLKHQEAAITCYSRTEAGNLVSDMWQTGWWYAENNSESKNKVLPLKW